MEINASRFLTAFNKIENLLQRMISSDSKLVFYRLINEAKNKNAVLRKFEPELREFGDLRNAIVHSYSDEKVIAVPIIETVNRIEEIESIISNPKRVGDEFKCDVITIGADNYLSEILPSMKSSFISQVPIIEDGKVLDILNTNTIARWLADNNLVDAADTKVRDLLEYIEIPNNYKFVKSTTNIFSAAEKFKLKNQESWFLDALLITHDGKNDSKLIGIIVIEDLGNAGVL